MIAVGLLFSFFSYPQLGPIRELCQHGVRTAADVIDARISSDMHGFGKSYDIRYRFRLKPHGPSYEMSERGPLARNELWATLPKEQWDEAARSGKVEIEYLPSDPSVNEIAGNAGKELIGVYALMGFAAVFGVPGAILCICAARPTRVGRTPSRRNAT